MNENKTHTKTFHLWPEGPDTDYGPMRHERVKVTIEQSWPFDDDQVGDMKDALKEHYDCTARTDEDLAEENAHWEREAEKLRQVSSPAIEGKEENLPCICSQVGSYPGCTPGCTFQKCGLQFTPPAGAQGHKRVPPLGPASAILRYRLEELYRGFNIALLGDQEAIVRSFILSLVEDLRELDERHHHFLAGAEREPPNRLFETIKMAIAEIRIACLPPDTQETVKSILLQPSTKRLAEWFVEKSQEQVQMYVDVTEDQQTCIDNLRNDLSAAQAKIKELEADLKAKQD